MCRPSCAASVAYARRAGYLTGIVHRTSIAQRLAVARKVVDQAWPIYDASSDDVSAARAAARQELIRRAVDTAFPHTTVTLTEADVAVLVSEATAARRSQVALLRLWREGRARRDASEARGLTTWGAGIAARQAGDWVKLVDHLVVSLRRYQVVRGADAGPAAKRRMAQRFARRCAAELSIAAPEVRWIRPVGEGGDLVTLGDIAGCAPVLDPTVIYVRADICSERERLRVVAHEVAHHGGASECDARDFELRMVGDPG